MSKQAMNTEERILFLEFMMDAIIWGPHLENREYRKKIADHLYTCIEASQRHQAHPVVVQQALLRVADGLAEIDSVPNALRPMLRSPILPSEHDE